MQILSSLQEIKSLLVGRAKIGRYSDYALRDKGYEKHQWYIAEQRRREEKTSGDRACKAVLLGLPSITVSCSRAPSAALHTSSFFSSRCNGGEAR